MAPKKAVDNGRKGRSTSLKRTANSSKNAKASSLKQAQTTASARSKTTPTDDHHTGSPSPKRQNKSSKSTVNGSNTNSVSIADNAKRTRSCTARIAEFLEKTPRLSEALSPSKKKKSCRRGP